MRQPCTTVCDRARRYTTVYDSRIAQYTEHRCFPFNHLVFLYDLRIRNPFPTVSLGVHALYTEAVHDLCISVFFSVNGRLRSCMFDLGMHVSNLIERIIFLYQPKKKKYQEIQTRKKESIEFYFMEEKWSIWTFSAITMGTRETRRRNSMHYNGWYYFW